MGVYMHVTDGQKVKSKNKVWNGLSGGKEKHHGGKEVKRSTMLSKCTVQVNTGCSFSRPKWSSCAFTEKVNGTGPKVWVDSTRDDEEHLFCSPNNETGDCRLLRVGGWSPPSPPQSSGSRLEKLWNKLFMRPFITLSRHCSSCLTVAVLKEKDIWKCTAIIWKHVLTSVDHS